MGLFKDAAKEAGSTAVEAGGRIVDDIQDDLTERLASLRALLAGHRIVIRIEIEEKEPKP
jgi:hypothetical protein